MIDTEKTYTTEECQKVLDFTEQAQNIFDQIEEYNSWTQEDFQELELQQNNAYTKIAGTQDLDQILEVIIDGPFLAPLMYKLLAKNVNAIETMNKNSRIIENIINQKIQSAPIAFTPEEKKAIITFLENFIKLQNIVKQTSKKAMIEAYKNACIKLNLTEKEDLNTLDQYVNDPDIEKEANEAFESDIKDINDLIERFK